MKYLGCIIENNKMIECVYCTDGIWHGQYIVRCIECNKTNSHAICHRAFVDQYQASLPCDSCSSTYFITGSYFDFGDVYIRFIKRFITV